jgi:endonuclease III
MPKPKLPPAKQRVPLVMARLAEAYPDTGTALHFADPFQLLVATILSAQCTDAQVNKITPALFAKFPTPQAMAAATVKQIIPLVKSTGFFRNKAKNIHGAATAIMKEHGGQVPGTLEQLVALPGVGRKTANVVLGDGFGVTGITVDTHVGRLSRRLGFTRKHDPVKVEMVLNKLVPQAEWTRFSHRLILHGRAVCNARKPRCGDCTLRDVCPRVGVPRVTSHPPDPTATPGEPT